MFLAAPVAAGPISGVLNITGDVTVTGTTMDWSPLGGTSGIVVVGTSTGSFLGLGGTGVMLDLNSLSNPAGVAWPPVLDFLTLSADPTLSFELQYINQGIYSDALCGAAPASGQNCTPTFPPPKSPFNLTNLTASSSQVSMTLGGIIYQSGIPVSNFTGVYTAQFAGMNYQQVLQTLAGAGSVNTTFSASFLAEPIPEPATAFLIFGALAALPLVRRFRKS
ncbi:MAG: hypothetical protein LLG20_24590 [Acidobacteriales bacterium]|nr:hypothetical protein [Terriglobales bacterium]